MPDRYRELTGFVLAGGTSRRMGRPKQDLRFGDGTLLASAVRLTRSVARTVAVLGPADAALGLATPASGLHAGAAAFEVPAFPDEISGRGPLGAILTGLGHTRTEYNLFLSCDLPFMRARFLRLLAGCALESQADITLAETPREGYQPLAAIYRRRTRAAVRASLESGHNKITHFFTRVPNANIRVLRWSEVARAGFQPFIFDNLNTPEDYRRALRRIGAADAGIDAAAGAGA